jgi:hypothetical protein
MLTNVKFAADIVVDTAQTSEKDREWSRPLAKLKGIYMQLTYELRSLGFAFHLAQQFRRYR